MTDPPPGIKSAPSPWLNVPISIYLLPFISSPPLLDHAYAPLEAKATFAEEEVSGKFKGGIGTIQIVRYSDSPVGSYDELIVIPGKFEVGKSKKVMLRISRIYVSQVDTAWNGRKNWNIPKHLAKFLFTTTDNTVHLEVFPPSSSTPFLKMNLTPFKYLPAIPFSTTMSKYICMDLRLAQPPLPSGVKVNESGNVEEEYLCGTEEWRVAAPEVWGKGRCCWVDLDHSRKTEVQETTPLLGGAVEGVGEGEGKDQWWPAYRPWKVGLYIEDGRINFSDAEVEGVSQ